MNKDSGIRMSYFWSSLLKKFYLSDSLGGLSMYDGSLSFSNLYFDGFFNFYLSNNFDSYNAVVPLDIRGI